MIGLLPMVAERVPWMQSRADALDRGAAFPIEEFDLLRGIGALSPSLPVHGHAGVDELASLLSLVGQGNLSVGRVLEAHINALHLIARYGATSTWHDDCLFGLWVTDPPQNGLRMRQDGSRISPQVRGEDRRWRWAA
ncbi:MAG: hypothetical protein P4L90_05915 [Rhodopila sp.]|nr:hypothetical protein [Rhodopila sp.]